MIGIVHIIVTAPKKHAECQMVTATASVEMDTGEETVNDFVTVKTM